MNPERPWPSLERLRSITAERCFELAVHPEAHVAALATEDGLA